MIDIRKQYHDKVCSPEEAVRKYVNGENLILSMGVSQPYELMKALACRVRAGELDDVPVYYMHGNSAARETLFQADLMDRVHLHSMFKSSYERSLSAEGRAQGKTFVDFIPCVFNQAGRFLVDEIGADYFFVTVSPMDSSGYFSLGTSPDYGATVIRHAKHVIVEENPNMPRTFGECCVHISDIHAIVRGNRPLMEHAHHHPKEEDYKIGKQIVEHINDGDTIQMGVGGVPAVVCECLGNHKDLGLHSELFSPAMVELIRKGVLTGKKKTFLPYKHIFTLALGDRDMFDFMDDNPAIAGYPVSFTNDPAIIAQNHNLKSVNSAIEVDLTGQVNSEFVNRDVYSGTGGQLDFVRGAYLSPGGKSFIALKSTAKNGTISTIVPRLTGPATDPRTDVHHIVTEHGLVNLKGKSLKQRAELLISIADPKFQEELVISAKESGIL